MYSEKSLFLINQNLNRFYLYFKFYIRYKIHNIKNINDIISIFKKINYFYYNYNLTTDNILNFLIECFNIYPLTENEMRIISIIQQNYQNDINIYGFVSLTLWLAVVEHINYKLPSI